jgi:Tfp pilus assembly protein PilN
LINLLPPAYSEKIHSGRFNEQIRKWILGFSVACGGLLVIILTGYLLINQQIRVLQTSIQSQNDSLNSSNLTQIKSDATKISGNLKVINQVLGQEVHFSKLIQEIGKVMPAGSVLESLTLSNKVSGALDLSAQASTYKAAAQIAVNLSDPANNIFTKVDIVQIGCSPNPLPYPCTGSYKALFDSKAQSRFLNATQGSSQ